MSTNTSKSEQIRQALASNPRKTTKQIAEILKNQGIVATSAHISVVKSNLKKKRRGRTAVAKSAKPAAATSPAAKSGTLDAALNFVSSAGSFAAAREALTKLEKLGQLANRK